MSFRLGDMIVKDILYALASDITSGDPLYVLTQLSDATIDITSEATDVTDKDGNIVKRIYKSKQGTFSATNAFLNANILSAAGAITDFAAVDGMLIAPKIIKVKRTDLTVALENLVSGSVTVNEYFGDGSLGKSYTLGTTASATEFAITAPGAGETASTLTLPTDEDAEFFMVTFKREFAEGAVIRNSSKEFPESVNMLLKVLYYNPCDKSSTRAAYVEMPSFMLSPETSVSLSSDTPTQSFNGTLEIDYCSDTKDLYNIYIPEETEED